jgi:predicted 2-oxoglutarate/Fe(II)-dependent dioxygenase YbiX
MRVREVHSGIFVFPVFTRVECKALLARVEKQRGQDTPPNTMNRYGAALGSDLRGLLTRLVQRHVAPIAARHYPEFPRGLRKHPYGFVVDYDVGKQRSLASHCDSSDVTLNVCLGHSWEGGELLFYDADGHKRPDFSLVHKVGQAILHRGSHAHRAAPITRGSRSNLILWCDARKSAF